jgi:hypothetical protein
MPSTKKHPLWPAFKEWCEDNGVDLKCEVDWKVWWSCFIAGAAAGNKLQCDEVTKVIEKGEL